jgi:ribose/xylose/arabinose/galactoside ABC-type transport system permease subunit
MGEAEGRSAFIRLRSQSVTGALRPWLMLALVCAVFSLHPAFRNAFWQASYLPNVLQQSARNIVLAVGMTFVIVTGGIDLSGGSVLGLAGAALALAMGGQLPVWLAAAAALPAAVLAGRMAYPAGRVVALLCGGVALSALTFGLHAWSSSAPGIPVAIAVGLLVASCCGLTNGALVSWGRVPPFVATLGMYSAARGLTLYATNSSSVPAREPVFLALGQGAPLLIITLTVVAAGAVLLSRTRTGRYALAIGGNEQATVLAGVRVPEYKAIAYVLSGLTAGIAAVLVTAKFGTANTGAGTGAELEAIAAVVIGGTSLSGGQGSIIGALVGALTITVIEAGLVLVGVQDTLQTVVLGAVIVLTVFLDGLRRR